MSRKVTAAAIQMAASADTESNIARADRLVRQAAEAGANIILLQEFFATYYFCQVEDEAYYELAQPADHSPLIRHFRKLAAELGVVLPLSFYERAHNALYNSIAIIDADGSLMGIYRKSHIPDGPGYEEKFYFNPGDTGFRVWDTRFGRIGVGICWDQWFPESARAMALLGAELLFYPTAIGSEPHNAAVDSKGHWQRCMAGHAAANLVPVIACNRVGTERFGEREITFYGSSFITDGTGEILRQADRESETILAETFDLDALAAARLEWGVFRDRRPDLYGPLLTLDGRTQPYSRREF